mmetsp:Transcript_4701/g.17039  ORF Transcript_4701/g.17039 Transcript_4701/m.17039 type:complete len:174 (-) Transcript_4701:271-792(-)
MCQASIQCLRLLAVLDDEPATSGVKQVAVLVSAVVRSALRDKAKRLSRRIPLRHRRPAARARRADSAVTASRFEAPNADDMRAAADSCELKRARHDSRRGACSRARQARGRASGVVGTGTGGRRGGAVAAGRGPREGVLAEESGLDFSKRARHLHDDRAEQAARVVNVFRLVR